MRRGIFFAKIGGGAGNLRVKYLDYLYRADSTLQIGGGIGTYSAERIVNNDAIITVGDGKDIICDFDDDDLLQVSGTFTASYNVGTNKVLIKVGSTASAITLQDFTASTFNINGDRYAISG